MCYLTRMNRFEMSNRARALRAALEENGIDPHAVLPGRTEGRHQALYVMLHQRLPAVTIPTQLSDGLEVRVVYYENIGKVQASKLPRKPKRGKGDKFRQAAERTRLLASTVTTPVSHSNDRE